MNENEDFGEELNRELPPLVRRLMVHRGIADKEAAEQFLRPRLAKLSDPFEMHEMDAAVERILRAVDDGEYVCVYGDYDVDGVSAVTLLHQVLSAFGVEHSNFIPARTEEGYGLSELGITHALESCKRPPKLLITVDCGTTSVQEVDRLRSMGLDVIILDHHEPGAQGRPNACAVVNAKLEKQSRFTYLCSAGVVFKLAHALLKRRRLPNFNLKEKLDVVAVAIVADIVPLVDENRLLTHVGLRLLSQGKGNLGLRALVEVTGMQLPVTSSHIAFRIGPRINAAGRIDSPRDALELLTTDDEQRAFLLAQNLEGYNRLRQSEEEKIREEALQMLHENHDDARKDHVIVLGSRNWHPGVVGIVASTLMRRFHKPCFIISFDEDGTGKGSGRSIPGISLVEALHACRHTIVAGGGHDMAAGLEIRADMLNDFRQTLNDYVREHSSPEMFRPVLTIDAEVNFDELNVEMLDSYALLEPFGNANPQPVLMSRGVMLSSAPIRLANNHLRLPLRQGIREIDAMYFHAADRQLPDPPWDIAFTIDRNVWRGRTSLSVSIQDIRPAEHAL